jgi:hypothetical protein
MNHDYDSTDGSLTPKGEAPKPGGNPSNPVATPGQDSNKSRFRLPQSDAPKHADPKTGKPVSINSIIDSMS